MMPQWEFLDFVADEAQPLSRISSCGWSAEATDLIEEGGRVTGVALRRRTGRCEIRAELVVAADGRDSLLRDAAALPVATSARRWTCFWFRLSASQRPGDRAPTGVSTPAGSWS